MIKLPAIMNDWELRYLLKSCGLKLQFIKLAVADKEIVRIQSDRNFMLKRFSGIICFRDFYFLCHARKLH